MSGALKEGAVMRAAELVKGSEGGSVYIDCMRDMPRHRRVIAEVLGKVVAALMQIVFGAGILPG